MGYTIRALPAGVGPAAAFDAMIRCVRSGGERDLPRGYDVEWQWRNASHLPLKSDPIRKTAADSARGGFRDIMIERLEEDKRTVVAMLKREKPTPRKRSKTKGRT